MIDHHLGCLDANGVFLQPLGEVAVGSAADVKEPILNAVEFVIVARLVVDIVAQVLQIFHSRAASLDFRGK